MAGGGKLTADLAWFNLCEEHVDQIEGFAERTYGEALKLFDSSLSHWHLEADDKDVKVYTMAVPGTELIMIRADADVQAEPDPLFAFFTSVAGYKVIDPACNNHDDKPLRQWSEREDVAYARAPLQPPQRPRTFLVANIADPARRLFVSKSILDDSRPPGGDGTVRAINTFALRTGAGRGGGAALQILDFFDMRGDDFMTTPNANRWHAHEFVQDILARLRAAMAAGALDAGRTL